MTQTSGRCFRRTEDLEGRTNIVLVTQADWSLPPGAQAIKLLARSIPFDYAAGAGSPLGGSAAHCSAPVCAGCRGIAIVWLRSWRHLRAGWAWKGPFHGMGGCANSTIASRTCCIAAVSSESGRML